MIADRVNDIIDDFTNYLYTLSDKTYKQLIGVLHQFILDKEGNIKITVKNLVLLNKVKIVLNKMGKDPKYKKKVGELEDVISEITEWQTANFEKSFNDFEGKPRVIEEYQNQAFETLKESLMDAGIKANVVDKTADIVKQHINTGASFTDLTDAVKKSMLGDEEIDPRFVSYVKQVVNDTLHGVARNYNAKIADDLGLVWFEYTGGLVKHSRPWCVSMEKKQFAHISELPAICRGEINGEQVSLQGLFPGTDKDNVINNCGGYNCEHHFTPVSSARVPTRIRRKFEPDIESDEEEKSYVRPRRR